MKRISRVTCNALRVALSLGAEVEVVQVVAGDVDTEDLSQRWRTLVEEPAKEAGHGIPRLTVIQSPYREFFGPLIEHVQKLTEEPGRRPIAVMIPELVEKKWYNFLFRHRATLLKELLILNGNPQILVTNAPWYLERSKEKRRK